MPLTRSLPTAGCHPHISVPISSTTSNPAPASPPARGEDLRANRVPRLLASWEQCRCLRGPGLPRSPAASLPPLGAYREGRWTGETFSAGRGGGSGSRYSRPGQRSEPSSGSLSPTAWGRRRAGARCRLCRRRRRLAAPSPGPGLASSLPPRRRALALYNSTRARPGLCKGWRRPAANGAAAGAGAQAWGAHARPIAARGARGAGWGKGRLPALI